MTNHPSDLVDASVPSKWLPHFIGHHIWTRPTSAPQIAPAQWCELLDVWVASHAEGEFWWGLRRAVVTWNGMPTVTKLARNTHVQAVPADECTSMLLENGATFHEWTTPFDDPPNLEQRPWDWAPTITLAPTPEPEAVPTDAGPQFILF